MLRNFLSEALKPGSVRSLQPKPEGGASSTRFCKRVIACLDVRANDHGDLVVTKGDQYDVRGGGDLTLTLTLTLTPTLTRQAGTAMASAPVWHWRAACERRRAAWGWRLRRRMRRRRRALRAR